MSSSTTILKGKDDQLTYGSWPTYTLGSWNCIHTTYIKLTKLCVIKATELVDKVLSPGLLCSALKYYYGQINKGINFTTYKYF